MTLTPDKLGDKGQRYVVHAEGYPKPGDNVIGYSEKYSGANKMLQAILKAPDCTNGHIVDRLTGEITIPGGVCVLGQLPQH